MIFDMERQKEIRAAEAKSHTQAYTSFELFAPGSWLAKPVKTVLELLPLFEEYSEFRALDLGSGVGRNSIPVAQYFKNIPCRVECVDILKLAVEKLDENARRFGVENAICGIVSTIDAYRIEADRYDLIMAVSALEHVDSETTFVRKLEQIRDGLRAGGVACLIVNTGVQERHKATGQELPPQFEVNMPTAQMNCILEQVFADQQILKHTVVHQKYDIPRACGLSELETDVVTCVIRKGEHSVKKLYLDRTECSDCVSVFVKDAQVINAGTTINAMSVKHRNAEYDRYAREYGIHFIFDDAIPLIDFYSVPQIDVFATDENGGLLGTFGAATGDAPVCYIDPDRNCYMVAASLKEFVCHAAGWKRNLQPYRDVDFYGSKAEAEEALEFITPFEWK